MRKDNDVAAEARGKIAVIGMMASGKTTIGRAAAEKMGIPFADADDEIEARAGMSVRDYFARYGEEAFRALELATVRDLLARPGALLVALGGGAFMQRGVRDTLRGRATTVFLKTSPEEIIRRLERTDISLRPVLASAADWRQKTRELTAQRTLVYAEADVALNTEGQNIPEAAAALAGVFQSWENGMREVCVEVRRRDHCYGIFVGDFLPDRWRDEIEARTPADRYFAVFDNRAADLHGLDRPGSERKGWTHLRLGAGEESKNLASVADLCERILAFRPDRHSVVVAVGGGVVGDMAGFAAAMLLRGLRFVQVPTTLLAQVDSSVGGKTGVNMAGGKNLLGAFHQPELVLIDPGFLKTLPEREYLSGLAEVVKYGLISDRDFFQRLTADAERLAGREPALLAEVTAHCCRMKAEIVGADETEKGRRGLLNLGHTFGHALEALAGYDGSVTHGEAVAVGMVLAADFAAERGVMPPEEAALAREGLGRLRLPTRIGDLRPRDFPRRPEEAERLRQALLQDKKAAAAKLTLVLPVAVGDCRMTPGVSVEEVAEFMMREA